MVEQKLSPCGFFTLKELKEYSCSDFYDCLGWIKSTVIPRELFDFLRWSDLCMEEKETVINNLHYLFHQA